MQQHAAILPPVATVREGNSRHLDHGLMRVVLMYVYAYVKILNLKIKSTSDSYIRGNVSLKRRDTKLALWVPSCPKVPAPRLGGSARSRVIRNVR